MATIRTPEARTSWDFRLLRKEPICRGLLCYLRIYAFSPAILAGQYPLCILWQHDLDLSKMAKEADENDDWKWNTQQK
jgi:hypothetical protein